MARARKLTPAAVRAIFKSTESAPKVASRFGVSTNLVYLIRQEKVQKKVTAKLATPSRANSRSRRVPSVPNIDVRSLADAIIDRFMARLFSHAGR
jgi:transposase-like protein